MDKSSTAGHAPGRKQAPGKRTGKKPTVGYGEGKVANAITGAFVVFLVVMGFGFGVFGTLSAVDGLRYATGSSGAPGHLVIDNCRTSGTGKNRHTVCYGTFTSLDGRTVDPNGSIHSSQRVGASLRVQEDLSNGDCYGVGVEQDAGWSAQFCGAVVAGLIGLAGLFGTGLAIVDYVRGRLPRRFGLADRPRRRMKFPSEPVGFRLLKAYFWTIAGFFGLTALSGIIAGTAAVVS